MSAKRAPGEQATQFTDFAGIRTRKEFCSGSKRSRMFFYSCYGKKFAAVKKKIGEDDKAAYIVIESSAVTAKIDNHHHLKKWLSVLYRNTFLTSEKVERLRIFHETLNLLNKERPSHFFLNSDQ